MIGYSDIYEIVRKEKYSETLQSLPKKFVEDVSVYFQDMKGQDSDEGNLFVDSIVKAKKQLENAIALFKELMLRRKKKILNLVFVAAETGIMKRDYENMLEHEREVFDDLVKSFEAGDKEVASILSGKKGKVEVKQRMVMFRQDVEQFVDMKGNVIGPFASGELANLDVQVSKILVDGGKAGFVDED